MPRSESEIRLTFAAWMAGSHAEGLAVLEVAAVDGLALVPSLAAIYRLFEGGRKRVGPGFQALDDLLRSDPTTVVDLDHPLVQGEVRRLNVLHRELQRKCLSATLLSLPVAPRAAFVLIDILGLRHEHVAEILGNANNTRTAYLRAERQLGGYLESRCEHMDPKNLCHCATRLGLALDRGFIDWPERPTSDAPLDGQRRVHVRDLFAALPPP